MFVKRLLMSLTNITKRTMDEFQKRRFLVVSTKLQYKINDDSNFNSFSLTDKIEFKLNLVELLNYN